MGSRGVRVMQLISVFCPLVEGEADLPAVQQRGRVSAGFTLLEMLVVLALLALVVGLVAPRTVGWLDAARERGWRDDFKAYLEALPVRCFLAGEPRQYDARSLLDGFPGAPSRLEIRLPQTISYNAQGVSSGGTVELLRGDSREIWRIEPITGRVREGR